MNGNERGADRRRRPSGLIAATVVATVSAIVLAIGAAAGQAAAGDEQASVWQREQLTGDWGGARKALKDKSGVDITLNYIGETLAVMAGGLNRAASYEGRLELSVDTELDKLIGWTGATTHVTVFQIHNGGRNAGDNAGSIMDPSNIDALATTRLFTAWFQQSLFNDRVSVRAGQLAGDDEFIVSPTAGGLINGTFGWAGLLASDMTGGGPAYPLAAPGLRIKASATEDLALLAAVFAGDPAGRDCTGNPQACNKYGTTFSTSGGALWMGEVQYAVNQGKQAAGLPGVYKLGAWYASADVADQHFGLSGAGAVVSLADPTLAGPLNHRGNWGLYGVADQTVWRGPAASVNLFVRGGFSPSDRNLVSAYVDGGIGIKGLLPGRGDDVLTVGAAYLKVSPDAAAADRDALALSGPPYAVRSDEIVFEASYAAQIAPWWIVQPDLQYIVRPNGGQSRDDPRTAIGHAVVTGVRSTIKF